MPRLCHFGLALLVAGVVPAAEPPQKPKDIQPDEARQHVGALVRVTMPVRKTKDSEQTKRVYLDSQTDYRDPKNLAVLIEYAAKAKFAEAGIEQPHLYYKDKTIQVTDKPFVEDDLVFIKAETPEQISIIERKK
jgi:hypothetical protein